jgi:hypothetical protein
MSTARLRDAIRTLASLALVAAVTAPVAAQQAPLPTNPHGPLREGVDCSDCHTSADWKRLRPDPRFDHTRATRFALTGAHATLTCARCHLDLRFDEPKADGAQCASCHVDVHRGNLGQDCARCHNSDTFRDVEPISLHQRSAFPLTGAHINTPCESCHKSERAGVFAAVPRDCISCHQSALDQAAASGIDHNGFPRDCTQCHVTLAWSGGTSFDHVAASGGYVLEGAHSIQRCTACHSGPGFALRFTPPPSTNQDCVACHLPDWQQAHGAQLFPQTCTSCHTQGSWASTFNHDAVAFPINSGAHRGKWATCATCHTVPGDYTAFTCLTCHAHNRTDMDDKHRERAGYVYDSQRCYSCHSRGGA